MTFLPIVDRELRVASRKRSSFWLRVLVAGGAIALFGLVMSLDVMSKGAFKSQLGFILFSLFSWLSFAFAAGAGVFLSADGLSEEKREGTLGLLFLTDLRGYDVVLGKLLASSLQAFYGLLAAFPVIAVSFAMGGVAGADFWKMMLVLCNTLFFSMAAGVFISVFSRDTQKAMSGTGGLMLVFLVVLPALDWVVAGGDPTRYVAWFGLASPMHSFSAAQGRGGVGYWQSLLLTHLIAWGLLAVACWRVKQSWQDRGEARGGPQGWSQRMRYGSARERRRLRDELLARNPVRWLGGRDLWLQRFLCMVLGCVVLVLFGVNAAAPETVSMYVNGMVSFLVGLAVELYLTIQAARFFVEASRNGILQLLLISPVTVRQIVQGQARSLLRVFLLPTLVLLGFQVCTAILQIREFMKNMAKVPGATGVDDMVWSQIVAGGCSLITFVTGLIALAWFSMWMGLTSRKVHLAVIKAVVFVRILPFFAVTFLQIALMFGFVFRSGGMTVIISMPTVISSTVLVVIHLGFVILARRKLLTEMRELAADAGAPAPPPRSHPALPTTAAPPVISA